MTDQCKHGSLRRSCEVCERDAEIERLRAEVERLMDGLYSVQRELGAAGMAHTTAGLLVARLCMRNYDDRIEELEEKLQQAVHVVDDKDKRIEGLERLAKLYSDGNQLDAHRLSIALGLEDDD